MGWGGDGVYDMYDVRFRVEGCLNFVLKVMHYLYHQQ